MSKLLLHAGARLAVALTLVLATVPGRTAQGAAPEALYTNASIWTGAGTERAQALLVKDGRIRFVGSSEEARKQAGALPVVDLKGQFVMPGLVDGHMHPLEGGQKLMKCSLRYERLTVPQMQAAIQKCLDATRDQEPNGWLDVVAWFREAMIPADADTTLATLDALKTKRPIIVESSFGHSALINTRARDLAKIDAHTPDPPGGRINHDAQGQPTGILEDAAYDPVLALIPPFTPAMNHQAALKALQDFRAQGITSFLDAAADPATVAAFAAVQREGALTARGHFAVAIGAEEGRDPQQAIATVKALAAKYDQGPAKPEPTIQVRNIKLFLDGVISAPAFTGAMLAPYFANTGTPQAPHWVPGTNPGPAVYFPPALLSELVLRGPGPASSRTCTPTATARCAKVWMPTRRCARSSPKRRSARRLPMTRRSILPTIRATPRSGSSRCSRSSGRSAPRTPSTTTRTTWDRSASESPSLPACWRRPAPASPTAATGPSTR